MSDPFQITRFTNLLEAFLQRPNLRKIEREYLQKVLDSPQERVSTTLLPTKEEIAAKLQHIEPISELYIAAASNNNRGDGTEDFERFTFWHLSCLFNLSEATLQNMSSDGEAIIKYLDNCVPFIRQFLRGTVIVPNDMPREGLTNKEARQDVLHYYLNGRNRNSCILTSRTDALDVCHIIPYGCYATDTATRAQHHRWHVAETIFGRQRAEELAKLLQEPGCTEAAWNRLTLSKCVRSAWDQGNLALEPLEVSETELETESEMESHDGEEKCIRVRVHWFYRYKPDERRYNSPVIPDADVKMLFQDLDCHWITETPHEVNIKTGQLVLTGNVYQIKLNCSTERRNMFMALSARWDLQRMQLCAGAAGVSDEELDEPPDAEYVSISEWVSPKQAHALRLMGLL